MKKVLFFLTTLTLLSLAWGGAVKAQQTLTVYDQGGDNSNYYVPMYGGYFDENTKTEFVIPAAQLEAMNGGTITSMKFYIFSVSGDYSWASTQTVFLKEVESDQLSAYSGTDGATIVYTGQFTAPESTETEFEINFQTPYEYHGGNLLVGIYNPAGGYGHYRFVYWFGENVNGASGSGNSNSSLADVSFSQKNFIPKTTFTYEAPAGCVKPANINVTALTSSSISVGWPAGNATSWNVYLNGTLTDDSPVSSNSYTFDNLTEYEVNYTIGVSAVCGSEVSDVTTTTVLLCVPAPSSVDYSGITNVSFGGVNDNFTMSSDPAPYYYDHSSQIGGASPGGTVDMSIEYDSYYGYYTWVWVDWNQDHTFSDEECVYTYTDPISSGTLELSFNVPATVAPGNYRVRIQGADNDEKKDPCYTGEWSCLVDYTLHIGEGCLAPAGLTATNVTHEGATLTWTNPNEGGSYIIKRVDGNVETVIEDNHTTTSYPITGLDPQTDYTYRVYIKCNASDISDSAEVSFSTTAPATAVGDYWSDDFEGTSCEWELINGNQTNAWVWGTATNNGGTHSLYISKDGGSTNTYSGASTKVFAAKLLNFTDSKYTFEYDWNCYGEKNWDFLRVALVPASETLTAGEDYSTIESSGSNSLPTGWIALDGGGQLNESTSWQNKSVAINVAAGNYYLVLAWRNDSYAYDPPAAVDNVSITKVACEYLVEGVQVINSTVTTSTANVLWDASEATAWQVQTKAGNGEWTTLSSSDVDFSLSGVKEIAYLRNLTPGTEYQVRVRANCGNEQYGAWSNVISFTTECAPRAVTNDNKFTANFDDMTGSTYPSENNLPICWNYINTCSYATYSLYPYVYWSSNESNSGANHLRFHSLASAEYTYIIPKPQYAILPPMQDVSNLRIKFYARAYNSGTDYDATFKVGVLTNPNDASTFTEIATYTPATTTYELYTIPFNTYSGNGNYIAIMIDAAEVPASGDFHRMLFIDDITVEPIPECVVPTNLRTVSVAHDGATVKWAANLEESWNLKYHAQGENQWIEVNGLQDSTYTFTELNAETEYEWQVQAACGANLTSDWSSLGTFTTEAAPANGDVYELFSGDLEEGDYLIVYDGAAMNTTVSESRLQYETVTISNNVIETNNAAIVWHIAPSGNYWTLYNADADAYAASTGVKNKAQMLAGSNDDKAKWTVSGTSVYEFVNKQNTTNNVNANLRRNGTYGFACYATSTGGALSLFKKVDNTPSIALSTNSVEAPDAGIDGTITVTYNNIDLTNAPEVQFFEADGTTLTTYNWLIADINNQNNVEYLIGANTGEARTAYFKVYGLDAQANDVYSELVTVSQAAYVAPPTPGNWVLTDLASITAQDTFVIVGTYQNDTYAMSNDQGTGAAPTAVGVTVVNNTIADPTNDIKWTVSGNATDGYTFYPNGSTSTWLYCTSNNNGVRVGTNDNKIFSISNDGYLYHDVTRRYVGIYNGQDWRCYTSINNNITGETFAFYMKDDGAVATTVTIDATGLTNTDVYTSTAAGTLSATVSANDAAIAGATVTWSSSDETVATIDNSGVVTLVAEGTTTITASYAGLENEYRSSSATYELVVTNSDPSGTYEDPYTVVEAIDATPSTSWVYTRGIVSRFYGNNTSIDQDNSHRYYISDDGTTTSPEMLVYKGYGLNHASFTSADDLLVGDTVIIYGQLTVYQNTEEINKDNYIVYLGRPVMQYHVSAIAADDNMGSVSGTVGNDPFASGDYAAGTQITLTATPAEGYDFSNWTKYAYPQGEEVSTNATYTFAVSEDIQLIAYFTPKVYNVTYELGQGAWVNGYYAPVTYTYGEGVTLPTAQNMEYENHTFGGWYDNAQFTGTPITEISTTAMGDTTLFAKWTIDTYEIALVQPANGTISSDPAQTAAVGAQVTLTATPNEGYSFDAWEVRNTTTGQTVDVVNNQFTMPAANVEVHASFTAIEYTVTATANPAAGGTITGTGTYSYEGAASLTASANNGYEFVNWTNEQGAVVCTTATYNFIVTRDSALTANFALKEYTITYMDGNTELDVDTFAFGADVTAIADPEKECKEFAGWNETLPATMPANNIVLYAQWNDLYYNITASADPVNGGSVTFNPEPEVGTTAANSGYLCNTPVTLTATPAQGYTFTGWSVNGQIVSADAEYDIIATQNSTLVATFIMDVPVCEEWQLVTSANDLQNGDQIIIAAANDNVAMSTTQNTNNRAIEQIVKTDNGSKLEEPSNDVQILTLQAGSVDNTWALYTGSGYLYAASSSNNYLKTQDNIDANASWTITVQNGNFTIKAKGSNTRNIMRYNTNSSIISCYSSGQEPLVIYKLADMKAQSDTTAVVLAESFEWRGTTYPASGDYEVLVGTAANGCDSVRVLHLTLQQKVATPTFTPAAGNYAEPQTLTIACATEGATIYYTMDGTEPTPNSTQYTAAITLNADTTVKAIAVKDGDEWVNSDVATAAYTFDFPSYTVTFNPGDNGTVPQATMSGNQYTEPVNFANNVPSPAATCTDWTFAGWSTTAVMGNTTTEPTFVTSPYYPTGDIMLYAVYQKTEQGSSAATWIKATSIDVGDVVVLVNENAKVELSGVTTYGTTSSYSSSPIGTYPLTVVQGSGTGYYSLKTSDNTDTYLSWTSGNALATSNTVNSSSSWDISINSNGNAVISNVGTTSRKLQYNSGSPRFACYTSSQATVQFYKMMSTSTTTYNSNPVCSYMVYVDGNMQNGTVIVDPATATTDGALIGSTVTLTATPNQGYHFGYWQVSTDATYTNPVTVTNNSFEMPTSDVYVNAIFWIDTLHITATVNPAQTGSVDPSEAYVIYGDQVTLTATPAQDYLFENWTSNGQPVGTDAVITITATQDSALVANFIQMDQVATPTFTSNPEGNTFTTEDVVTVTITTTTPNATIYYTMDGTDPVVPAGRNVTGTQVYEGPITLTETTTLKAVAAAENMINSEIATATYTINQMYYVDVDNSIEHGTVTADPEKGIENTQISLTAVPEEGYIFNAWNVYNANDADQTVTVTNNQFNMPAYDVMVSATFVPDTFTVTFVLNGAQFVAGYTPISRYWYKQQDANLPTAADMEYEGHSFDGWYENANFDGNSWTSVPDTAKSNKTYYAKWNVNSYDLTINYVDANGQTLAPAHTETLQYGASYNVSTPDVATYMPDQTVVSGNMGTAAVTVNVIYTQIVMNAVDNQTVCTGSTTTAVEFSLPTTLTQTFPNMEVMFEKNIDNTSIGIADETYGNIAAFTAVNVGTEPVVTTITVTPLCTLNNHAVRGVPQTFTITVTPKHTSEFSETVCDNYYWATADTTIVDEGSHDYVHVFANQYGCDSTVTLHLTLYKTPTSLTTTVTPNTSCVETAPNGAIAITAPTGDFEYSINGTDWQTTTEFANLAANTYTVYVRPVNSECAYTENVTVTDNVERPLSTPSVSKAYYCTTENVTLNSTGSSTGSEYTYAWTGPNNYESTETNPVLASPLTGEMSGTYQLTVTHTATGCVSEPASVEVVVNTPGTPGYLFTITTHGDAYANIDGSLDEVTPVFATPEVNHFLDGANVNYTVVNNAENSYNAVGDYTITWTATDECGNEATTTQVLHVTQNVCPVATDADNNTYPSVQLAGKCWMAKNLRTTRFSDGRAVNNLMVYDNIMYPNTTENLSRYGYLYDWDNAMDAQNGTVTLDANNHVQGICPTGWRIPNHNDFMDIAGSNSATDMYDLRYNQYWLDGGGNNSTNYSLLPGGCYNENAGRYENLIGNAYLWGVNAANPTQPRVYWADCKCYMWQVNDVTGGMGYSVRCIKD